MYNQFFRGLIGFIAACVILTACHGTVTNSDQADEPACSWNEDAAFTAFQNKTGTTYVTSVAGNEQTAYAAASSDSQGFVARWDGQAWVEESLPEKLAAVLRLDASAGRVAALAVGSDGHYRLLEKTNGSWKASLLPDGIKKAMDIRLFGDDILILSLDDAPVLWSYNGAWNSIPLTLTLGKSAGVRLRVTNGSAFVLGFERQSDGSNKGLLLEYNGQVWKRWDLPSDCASAGDIAFDGQGVVVAGTSTEKTGTLWRLENGQVTRAVFPEYKTLNLVTAFPGYSSLLAIGMDQNGEVGGALLSAILVSDGLDAQSFPATDARGFPFDFLPTGGISGYLAAQHRMYSIRCE